LDGHRFIAQANPGSEKIMPAETGLSKPVTTPSVSLSTKHAPGVLLAAWNCGICDTL
jgi:hypothetical protein